MVLSFSQTLQTQEQFLFCLILVVHIKTIRIKVPPFHSPVRLSEPEPGSALHCSGEWQTPLPPESQSVQTQTADANLGITCRYIRKKIVWCIASMCAVVCMETQQSWWVNSSSEYYNTESSRLNQYKGFQYHKQITLWYRKMQTPPFKDNVLVPNLTLQTAEKL